MDKHVLDIRVDTNLPKVQQFLSLFPNKGEGVNIKGRLKAENRNGIPTGRLIFTTTRLSVAEYLQKRGFSFTITHTTTKPAMWYGSGSDEEFSRTLTIYTTKF